MDTHRQARSRAEFLLCLARAFAVPNRPGAWEALRDALPEDLTDLAAECGYPLPTAARDLRAALSGIADGERLLAVYSRLFLVPGAPHPQLNVGLYLDGALAGGTCQALLDCYRQCGLAPDADFHDLPDHLTLQLEFLAWLLLREADGEAPPLTALDFMRRFVARWIGPFRQDLEQAGERFALPPDRNPYLALARMLETAVDHELRQAGLAATETLPTAASDTGIARQRRQRAGQPLTETDLAFIRQRLAADGLPHDHIAIPLEDRDRVMGLTARQPPAAPSHRMEAVRGA